MLTSAFYAYTSIDSRCLVYADTTTDGWKNVTSNEELADAFRAYCKSRDLTIRGSVADGVTQFTTTMFNNSCRVLGIDVTALQAHLKYETDDNLGIRYLFDRTGINAYNRIFSQFLQDNNLRVGDTANEERNTLASGKAFIDIENNFCFIHILHEGIDFGTIQNYEVDQGTYYKYNEDYFALGHNPMSNETELLTFNILSDVTRTQTIYKSVIKQTAKDQDGNNLYNAYTRTSTSINGSWMLYKRLTTGVTGTNYYTTYESSRGSYCIVYRPYDQLYYLARVCKHYDKDNIESTDLNYSKVGSGFNIQPFDQKFFLTTNNTVINNNNYEGDTIINYNGDPESGEPEPEPEPDPDPYQPPDYPSEPTDNPSDWGVELPDLDIPWFLRGKEDKFPWDIPYSMIVLLSVLNAEPEAPHIDGTLDLGVYEWNYELDLSEFDDVALICRNMMFVAFLFGLMLLTKRLIWG